MTDIEQSSFPGAPTIAGLRFRRLEDESDYQGMADVRVGCVKQDRIDVQSPREGLPTAAELAGAFPLHDMRSDPDLLIVTMNETVIGYAHVVWRWTEVTGERVYLHLGYLLPEWRGLGIGSAMLRWSQGRIIEIAMADRLLEGRATFATNVSSTESEAARLVEDEGYTVVWQLSDMILEPVMPVSPSPFPVGIDRRTVRQDQHRAIYHACKDAYARIWTSTPPSEEDFGAFVRDNFTDDVFDPGLCEIAWSGDDVAGLVLCRARNGVGVIAEVAVRPLWQRHGIARALMLEALGTLHQRGVSQARLFTDAGDHQGARSLYEQLGFRESKRHAFYRKPFMVGNRS